MTDLLYDWAIIIIEIINIAEYSAFLYKDITNNIILLKYLIYLTF